MLELQLFNLVPELLHLFTLFANFDLQLLVLMHVAQAAEINIVMVILCQRVKLIGFLGGTGQVPKVFPPHPHLVHGFRDLQTPMFVLVKGVCGKTTDQFAPNRDCLGRGIA